MATIDLSILPRLISVLEDLPSVQHLRLKIASLESQLIEKQQVIDSLQSLIPATRQQVSKPEKDAENSETVRSLTEVREKQRLNCALELAAELQKENQMLKEKIGMIASKGGLKLFEKQTSVYKERARECSRQRLECLITHEVRERQVWSAFVPFLTVGEVYSLGKISEFWRVNVYLSSHTWEHLLFSLQRPPALIRESEEPLQLDDASKRLLDKYC